MVTYTLNLLAQAGPLLHNLEPCKGDICAIGALALLASKPVCP